MRRDFVLQATYFARLGVGELVAQAAYFIDQGLDLLLLTKYGAVQRIDLVFSEA